MSFEIKLLLTCPTQEDVIVTRGVYGKVPIKVRGLGGQYRNREQALIARILSTAYGHRLKGGER